MRATILLGLLVVLALALPASAAARSSIDAAERARAVAFVSAARSDGVSTLLHLSTTDLARRVASCRCLFRRR